MKILLTGSTGQLGHYLQSTLATIGTVIIAPREQMDLSQPELVRASIRDIKPDLIVNPAAYTAVDRAESERELAYAINAESPQVMAKEAKRLGIALVHYSTDYVFNGEQHAPNGELTPYFETDATDPINVYGASKLAGENAIRASGCDHLILRTSWVYSLFGKNFLLTMLRLANEREELKIVADQWGAPSSAPWLATATTEILAQYKSMLAEESAAQIWWEKNSGTYHMTPTGFTSWCGFTEEIVRLAAQQNLLGKPAPRISGIPASDYPTPAKRPMNSRLNTDLLAKQFALSIPSWQEALAECLVPLAAG
jgi:dTDP-4-dehydrorhamnose reductase